MHCADRIVATSSSKGDFESPTRYAHCVTFGKALINCFTRSRAVICALCDADNLVSNFKASNLPSPQADKRPPTPGEVPAEELSASLVPSLYSAHYRDDLLSVASTVMPEAPSNSIDRPAQSQRAIENGLKQRPLGSRHEMFRLTQFRGNVYMHCRGHRSRHDFNR